MTSAQRSPSGRRAGLLPLLALAALLAACASPGGSTGGGSATGSATGSASGGEEPPADPDALVLQVALVGGFTTAEEQLGRLPLVTVHADGRVLTQGPVAAIYPPFAWPALQVTRIDPGRLPELVARAVDAGVVDAGVEDAGAAVQGDLGDPGIADAATTRFTLVTGGRTVVREVHALTEGSGSPMLTGDQQAARARLAGLATDLADLASGAAEPWSGSAVAVLAVPYRASGLLLPGGATTEPQELPGVAWPGPALPGEPLAGGVGCVVVTGEQAAAVRAAASGTSATTPWTTPDGGRWSLTFRPLLPHESGCADLLR